MSTKDAEEILDILSEFGINTLSEDVFHAMKRGDLIEFTQFISELPKITKNNVSRIKQLTKILRNWSGKQNQSDLWASLREIDVRPDWIELISFYLLQSGEDFLADGVQMYMILLSMEPALSIWNPILFRPFLGILAQASQIIEEGGALTSEIEKKLQLTIQVFPMVLQCFSASFVNMIGDDVYMALSEATIKLASGYRPEYEKFNSQLQNTAFNLLGLMLETKTDVILQYIVPWSLLQFATSSSTTTARLERLHDRIIQLLIKSFKKDDPYYILFIKHLILRVPDRANLKVRATMLVFELIKNSDCAKELIDFVMKVAQSNKVSSRVFSSQLLAMCVVQLTQLFPDSDLRGNVLEEMLNILKKHVIDRAPSVRATALSGLSTIISNLKDHEDKGLILENIDTNKFMIKILKARSVDEKLVVRRASLETIREIIYSRDTAPDDSLIDLIDERVRDWSVSIRVSAVKTLGDLLDSFPNIERLHRLWLDAILPLIEDPEQSVQKEAIDAIRNHLIKPVCAGSPELFTKIMHKQDYEFLGRVFLYMRLHSIDLSPLCKALTKFVVNREYDTNRPYWRMLESLTLIVKSSFNKDFFKNLWYRRDTLPPEYYGTLAHLEISSDEIHTDLITIINQLVEEGGRYLLSHEVLKLFKAQGAGDDTELMNFISICMNKINGVAEDEHGDFTNIKAFSQTVYIVGELISCLNDPKRTNDIDFTGLQLLMSEKLPNGNPIPTLIRTITVTALGKLCLARKDISNAFASAFVHQIMTDTASEVKANCLIVLCDMCVAYSAIVEPHVQSVTNAISDRSPAVRKQALNVLTRLIVENFLKMSPLLFFRFLYSITDDNQDVAHFARICLFHVIVPKFPNLLKQYFIDTLMYFTDCEIASLIENPEVKKRFRFRGDERRLKVYKLLVTPMNEVVLFELVKDIFGRVIDRFIKCEFNLKEHSLLLSDSFNALLLMEDKLHSSTKTEANTDEGSDMEKVIEGAKNAINLMHNTMISTTMQSLKKIHQLVRENNSPLQKIVKKFYRVLCDNDKELLQDLERSEPILAAEIREEMRIEESEKVEDEEDIEKKEPEKLSLFNSPLLKKIHNTPISLLCSPAKSSTEALLVTPRKQRLVREFSTPQHGDDDFSD